MEVLDNSLKGESFKSYRTTARCDDCKKIFSGITVGPNKAQARDNFLASIIPDHGSGFNPAEPICRNGGGKNPEDYSIISISAVQIKPPAL